MKYGIHLGVWSRLGKKPSELINTAKNLGFDCVEVFLPPLDDQELQNIKKALKDTGMSCISGVALSEEHDVSAYDKKRRRNGILFLKKCIEKAASLESPLITGITYSSWGTPPEEYDRKTLWLNSVRSLKEVCKYAKKFDIEIGVEAVNRFKSYLINTAEDAIKFVKDVDEPNIKIHLDTFHMNIEEKDFYTPIVKTGNLLGYLHCIENDRGIPGTGHVDWNALFKALKEIRYDRWVVIETFPPGVKGLSEKVCAWRWVFPDEIELASKGLQFLQKMEKKVR